MKTRNNPFKVPENYFDSLEKDILSKVGQASKKQYFFPKAKQMLKYAAVILLFVAIGGTIWWNIPKKTTTTQDQMAITQVKSDPKPTSIATKIEEVEQNKTIDKVIANPTKVKNKKKN